MLSYEDNEEVTIPGKDMQIMILFLVDISIGKAGARIVSIDQTEILCGRFEQLNVTIKLYHKSISCDVLLKFYGLSAPEGTLAQSVNSEKKVNALAASFVHLPVGENVDWQLSAAIARCHVTSLHLQRFAVYLDSESYPWKLHKKWEDSSPVERMEIFADGIQAVDGGQTTSSWEINRNYLISPINGVLRYHRLGKLERHNPEIPFEKASLVLSDVLLTVTEKILLFGAVMLCRLL